MFGLEKLFGPKTDYKTLLKNGAVIVDVRSAAEFNGGHIKGARNISVELVQSRVKELLQLKKPIITCCASGVRSGMAARILKSAGIEAYNGGSWSGLQSKIS
jgi:rhodanese-related sulfurtransferase